MGIGNFVHELIVHEVNSLLITPHGDRKPHRDGSAKDRPLDLITPHGDRKLDVLRQIAAQDSDVPSLPLMGIGNPDDGASAGSTTADSHYPSWGSETCRHHPINRQVAQLITPHGDRKRTCSGSCCASSGSSLPLMGIGNDVQRQSIGKEGTTHYPSWGSETGLQRDRLLDVADGLITPHGDRKLVMRARARSRALSRSLITPHGDRKHSDGGSVREAVALITPHGDRKPEKRT